MHLEHHLVGGYVRYISPHIIIIIMFPYLFSPFPEVAEAVQSELETYRASEDEVKKLKTAMVSLLTPFDLTSFIKTKSPIRQSTSLSGNHYLQAGILYNVLLF